MAKVEFGPLAKADLADIDDYSTDQFGHDVADAYARGFNLTFDLLRRHPEAGAAHPEFGKGVRCIVHRKHRVFYTVNGDTVVIVRIIHHARDARKALN